ncbi:hypothetical protein [Hydrogenophaga sp.]|uniref:hypothetical protein n=1 Tax=Hydrogenophaga sp. TaxID=1904254 RepID=UPI0027314B60|nr:hypothetical protein [Hydrogenophaga sp.]MDP1688031.1 hypothetical protein [Hydrogenophaga sp.]
MSPKAFAAALRAFSQSVRLSPDPAASLADLAELMAVRADSMQRTNEVIATAVEQICKGAPEKFKVEVLSQVTAFMVGDVETLPDLDMDKFMADADPVGAFDHDELAFPPLVGQHSLADLDIFALTAAGIDDRVWADMPDEEKKLHRDLALAKLHQEHAADQAAA